MAGERNLATLIQSMTPEQNEGEYVFVKAMKTLKEMAS